MKKGLLVIPVLMLAATLFAASDAKEVTLDGTGKCAKCSMGTAEKCQTAVVVMRDGKEETYYLTQNDVAEKFHKNVCQEDQKVHVTGTVKEVDGKKELTASKIDVVKG